MHLMAKASISLEDWDTNVELACTLKLSSLFSAAKLKAVVLGEADASACA